MQLDQLKRRKFITLLGGAVAWPVSARAQRPAHIPRIGIIDDAPMWHSFRHALRELGYVEGQSVNYEYRYSEGVPDRPGDRGGRADPPPGRPDRDLWHPADADSHGGDQDDPDSDGRRRRSGARRPGGEPRPPRRQPHRQY